MRTGSGPCGRRVLVLSPETTTAQRVVDDLRRRGHLPTVARNPARAIAALVEAARLGSAFSAAVIFEAGLPVSPASFASLVRAESEIQGTKLVLATARVPRRGPQVAAGYAVLATTAEEAVHAVSREARRTRTAKRTGREAAAPTVLRQGIRVLVGEEDAAQRLAFRRAAEAGGYEVMECADGEQVLDALESARVDLGILGSQLGGMAGRDVAVLYRYLSLGGSHIPLLGVVEAGVTGRAGFPFDGLVPQDADPGVVLEALRSVRGRSPAQSSGMRSTTAPSRRSGLPG